jgi:hypothetical protein
MPSFLKALCFLCSLLFEFVFGCGKSKPWTPRIREPEHGYSLRQNGRCKANRSVLRLCYPWGRFLV